DIWAGTGSSNYAQEIMIWTDNHGQVPAGHKVGEVTIGGTGYQLWDDSGHNPVTLVLDQNTPSGSVDVLADLDYLMAGGYMPASSGINQIDYGFEICSTGGHAETFAVSAYSITSS